MTLAREKIKNYKKEYYLNNKEKYSKRHKEYFSKKHGKIIRIVNNINRRCYDCENASFKNYGFKGIQNYLTYEDLSMLWDRDNAKTMIKPSIDRIDADKDYTIGNCQFIELSENIAKDKRKKVVQTDLCGNVIKLWKSQHDASIELGISQGNISMCCSGKSKSYKGFKWKHYIN